MAEVIAVSKNLRISPKKVRLVAYNLRGKSAETSLESLRFVPRSSATPLYKVLKSAIANAKNNFKLDTASLKIKEILIDEGPTLKRYRPVSRGAAHRILKRTTHIKVVLEEVK
jgi:ribosomal protein L22, bacterial type